MGRRQHAAAHINSSGVTERPIRQHATRKRTHALLVAIQLKQTIAVDRERRGRAELRGLLKLHPCRARGTVAVADDQCARKRRATNPIKLEQTINLRGRRRRIGVVERGVGRTEAQIIVSD